MTKRQHILETIKEILESTKLFKTVKIENFEALDLTKTSFPVSYIYGGPEVRVEDGRGTIGFETWDWKVQIEVWVKGTDLDTILQTIHAALYANYRLNGLARYSYRNSAEPFLVDPALMIQGLSISYQVLYEHPQGRMEQ